MQVIQAGVDFQAQAGAKLLKPNVMQTNLTTALLNSSGVINLLIGKGIITLEELFTVMTAEAEAEAARYIDLANRAYAAAFRAGQARGDIPLDAECERVTIFIEPDGSSGVVTGSQLRAMQEAAASMHGDSNIPVYGFKADGTPVDEASAAYAQEQAPPVEGKGVYAVSDGKSKPLGSGSILVCENCNERTAVPHGYAPRCGNCGHVTEDVRRLLSPT
jgi:hypothetical protein